MAITKYFNALMMSRGVEKAIEGSVFDRTQDCCLRDVFVFSEVSEIGGERVDQNSFTLIRGKATLACSFRCFRRRAPISMRYQLVEARHDSGPLMLAARLMKLVCLCVPNIRFSMDAENRRGKFAT